MHELCFALVVKTIHLRKALLGGFRKRYIMPLPTEHHIPRNRMTTQKPQLVDGKNAPPPLRENAHIYYCTPLSLNLANNKKQQQTTSTYPCGFGHCSVPTLRIFCPCGHLGA